MSGDRGHRVMPHTADFRIEAWGSTLEDCLAESVSALVEGFADVSDVEPVRTITAELAADTDEDRLVAVLDQVIYLLDTENAVAVDLGAEVGQRTMRVSMSVVDLDSVEIVGASPKAVALSDLSMANADGRWSATAIIDV